MEGVIARAGRLTVRNKGDGFEVRSVVGPWGSFVSSAECALPAMRCPVAAPADTSGARDAHWDTPDFLAGVPAARGLGFIKAASHMPYFLPTVSTSVSFRAGPVAVCVSSWVPLALYLDLVRAQDYADTGCQRRPCLCCAVVYGDIGAFSPWA